MTQVLLNELPPLGQAVCLLHQVGRSFGSGKDFLALLQCLLEHGIVKLTLLVAEGSLKEHGMLALDENLLKFTVGNSQSQLICLAGDEFGLNEILPHLVADALHLLVGKVGKTIAGLDYVGVLVNLVVEFHKVDVLAVDCTNDVMAGHTEDLYNSCPVCSDEAYQTEEERAYHHWAGVSYFL